MKETQKRPSRYGENTMEQYSKLSFVSKGIERLYEFLSENVLLLILIVVGTSFLAMLALRIHLIAAYLPELGGVESNVIYSLQRILDGFALYVDPATAPYSITQYTPLYYYLCWTVGKILQVDPASVHQVYMLSRSVSLILNLLFAGAVFAILRNVFRINKGFSFVAFAYAFIYLDEESYSRPDSLYNLLVLVTIGLFLMMLTKEDQRSAQWYLVGASVMSVVSVFAKQSAIYVPVLLLFFLLFYTQSTKRTLMASLIMGITFGVLLLISGGNLHDFLRNTVQGVNNGASLSWFAKRIMVEHFQKERLLNILGLFIGGYYLAKGKSDTLRFLGLCILGSFSFALITSVKIGAAPNYFTEFIALTVIGIVIFVVTNNSLSAVSSTDQQIWGGSYKPLFYLLLVIFTLPPRFAGKFQKKVVEAHNVGEQGYVQQQAVANYLYEEEKMQPDDQVLITTHVQDYLNKFLYKNVIFPQKEIVKANPPDIYDYSLFKQGLQDGTVKYVVASLSEGHVDTTTQQLKIKYNLVEADFSPYVSLTRLGDYVIFKHQSAR